MNNILDRAIVRLNARHREFLDQARLTNDVGRATQLINQALGIQEAISVLDGWRERAAQEDSEVHRTQALLREQLADARGQVEELRRVNALLVEGNGVLKMFEAAVADVRSKLRVE